MPAVKRICKLLRSSARNGCNETTQQPAQDVEFSSTNFQRQVSVTNSEHDFISSSENWDSHGVEFITSLYIVH